MRPRRPRDTGPTRKVRALVLARDGYRCARCGAPVTGAAYTAHQRKRRAHGGADTPDNLVVLCGGGVRGCYGEVHAEPSTSYAFGWLVRRDGDPALVPVLIGTKSGRARVWLTPGGLYSAEPPEGAEP